MRPTVTLRQALDTPELLGSVLAGNTWLPWRTLLIASMGEKLTLRERRIFTELTGRAREPLHRVEELVAVVGRRGGKSRGLSTLAAYVSGLCLHDDYLVPGEKGVLLMIAPDQRQAAIDLDYCHAAFQSSDTMRRLVARRTSDTLELTNRVSIEVRAANFRRLRGPTLIAVLADESAFFLSDESANPDVEILNAVRPGLATTRGPLVIASSPYAKRGVLYDAHRRHYGSDGDPKILVAQGTSRVFNPSLPQSVVDRAMERDPASAAAEYLAQFRDDIAAFIPNEIVRACVGDFTEQAPRAGMTHFAFVDPSGGSSDSYTLAIGHRDGNRVVIDAIRERRPPFSPEQVTDEFAELVRTYGIPTVRGDHYAGEWPREQFRKRNVVYWPAERTKSDIYRDFLPLLNSERVLLPKSERLVQQLVGLERRTSRAGRDSIDHAPGAHDDLANAVAGVAHAIIDAEMREYPQAQFGLYTLHSAAEPPVSEMRQRIIDEMAAQVPPCLIDFAALQRKRRSSDGRET